MGRERHSALRQSRVGSAEETELRGAFDPCVDFIAQGAEVDRLGQKRLGAALKRLALGFRIAVGGDHYDWDVRPQGLRLAQKLKAGHPRHVDVRKNEDQRTVAHIRNALQRHRGRLRKLHREAVSAEIAPELLAKQHLYIGVVVNNQNKHVHTLTSLSAKVPPAAVRSEIR